MTQSDTPQTMTSVMFAAPKQVRLVETPLPPLKDGEFLVKTLYSAISAGTELTFFHGTNPKISQGWDVKNRLFRSEVEPDIRDVYPKLEGYMESAEVVASRHPDVAVGTRIAACYGHKNFHIVKPGDVWIPLPDELDPRLGVFVAHMGPICMNGILYAADEVQRASITDLKDSLKGQRVMIFGAGTVGLLCGVFARWAGASEVGIVDHIAARLDCAERLGLTPFPASDDLPLEVKTRWVTPDPLDTGADIAVQCTGSDALLSQAFACLREQGVVVDLGFYQQGANLLMLGKEFHHNRLRHVCAQIGALPRHQQAEWNKNRLSKETIAVLRHSGDTLIEHMISHTVPFSEAQDIYQRLAGRDPSILQVVLQPDA